MLKILSNAGKEGVAKLGRVLCEFVFGGKKVQRPLAALMHRCVEPKVGVVVEEEATVVDDADDADDEEESGDSK